MELILASIIAFASTNIDDIFILILFFGNKNYKSRDIVIGQYLGVGALILISLIGSLIGLVVDIKYIGMLGLIPIFFGVKGLIRLVQKKNDLDTIKEGQSNPKTNSILTVAGVTFANGGDNIGIYIPLFATLSATNKIVMVSIFLIMIALWCIAGKRLSGHPMIAKAINRYGHIITPVILICLGVYILYESGTFGLL